MNNLEFVQLSKPKGRAYANNSVVNARENVKALSIQRTIDKFQLYNDSLYPINDNFTLITWETRFNITPLDGQTIEERTAVVKKKMDFPKGQKSRLSLDYIQSQLDYFGFSAATVYYNEEGDTTGYIHGNNYTASEKYTTGLDKYNSFIVGGKMDSQDDYIRMLRLLVSLKPLDCFIVDRAYYQTVLAIDATTILAVNGTQALLLNSNSNRAVFNPSFNTDGLLSYYDFSDITTAAIDNFSDNDIPKIGESLITESTSIGSSSRVAVSGFTVSNYFGTDNFSQNDSSIGVSFWIKLLSNDYGGFLTMSGVDSYINSRLYPNNLQMFYYGSTDIVDTLYPSLNNYHLISFFYDLELNTITTWIDGVLFRSSNQTFNLFTHFRLGKGDYFDPFSGKISDISIWSEFSTEKHIELYNNGDGLFLTLQ